MLRGPDAYRALDDALRDIRREEDDITRRIGRTTERMAKAKETEVGLMRDLARLRLDPRAQGDITGTLVHAEQRAREMLAAHAKDVGKLEEALGALETRLAELSRRRGEALTTLGALQETFAAFETRAAASLAADPAYRELQTRRGALDAIIAKAEEKAEQAQRDRADKGRPYDADPLFAYLRDRKFGTPDYKAAPLFRYLDGKVAQLVRYPDARANYATLQAIPERLVQHVERLRADRESDDAAMDAAQQRAIDSVGGAEVRRQIEEAEAAIAAIDTDIVAAEDERDRLTGAQKELAEGRDANFDQAVGVLVEALTRTDAAVLRAHAQRTPTPEDDAIVVKVEETRLRVGEDEGEIRDQRARLATLESRRRELEDISYEFKSQRFDDPRSRFGEDRLVGDLLSDFLRGAITASTYWGHWRSSQDWAGGSGPIMPNSRGSRGGGGFSVPRGGFSPRPPSGGTWGGGSGPSRPSGGNGGFSRPRTGSRGSRKGGGFKTGGGF